MLTLIRQNLRRAASLTLAAFLILSTLPPAIVLAAGSLTVSGTVTNQSGGGVLNVSVYATAPGGSTTLYGPATTSSSGAYSLSIDPGTYDIHFNPPAGSGLNPIIDNNYVVSSSQALNVQLTSPQHVLSGTLRDSGGNPLPSIVLEFTLVNGSTSITATTDVNGHYSINANAGLYYLDRIAGNVPAMNGALDIRNVVGTSDSRILKVDLTNTDVAQDFILPAASMSVTVKDNLNNLVSNTQVTSSTWSSIDFPVTSGGGAGYSDLDSHSATTNSSGVALLPVYATTYASGRLCANISGNQICNSTSVVVGSGGGSLTLQQPPTHNLSGTLRDGNGNPVPSVLMELTLTNGTGSVTATTDAAGHFNVAANAGLYYLDRIAGNVPAMNGALDIRNVVGTSDSRIVKFDLTSADISQDVTLPTNALTITVLDNSGNPVSNAQVSSGTWSSVTFPVISGGGAGYSDLDTHNTTTNSSGVATLPVYAATYPSGRICATISGNQVCNTASVTISGSGQTLTLQQPPTHNLSGTLRDGNGNPIQSMTLELTLVNGSGSVTATTDVNGHYSINANAGLYYLDRIAGNVPAMNGALDIRNVVGTSDSRIVKFDLTSSNIVQDITVPTASLSVTVKDGYGNPVSGVSVTSSTWSSIDFPVTSGGGAGYSDLDTHNTTTNSSGVAGLPVYTATYAAGRLCTTVSGNQLCNTAPVTVSGSSTSLLFQAAPQAPPAPAGLTASSPTSTAPVLNWSAVSVASNYNIYRNGTKIGSTTATTFTDSSLTVTGTYSYNVTAVSALNVESSTSNTVSVMFYGPGPAVTNVQVSPGTVSVNQTATLSANVSDANATVTAAEYFEGADPGQGNGTPMSVVAGVAAATLPSTLSVGQHVFTVRALDSLGNWTTGTLPTAALTVTLPMLSGKVTNFASSAVSGVRVDVASQTDHTNIIATTTTTSAGNYTVTIPTPGTYDVIYTPSDTTNLPLTKTGINLSSSNTLNVQLPGVQHTISGTITDNNGRPVSAIDLTFVLATGNISVTKTSGTGQYSVTVNAGAYYLSQLYGGGVPSVGPVLLVGGNLPLDATNGDVVQNLQLPVGNINVTVKDSYGNPVSGATVSLDAPYSPLSIVPGGDPTYGYDNVFTVLRTTDSSGAAAASDLATVYSPGTICARTSSYVICNSSTVTLAPNGTATVLLQATPKAPPAPTGLAASSPTSTAPVLNWSPVIGASSYNIYRSGTKIGSTTSTTFTDTGLTINGTYTYTVTSVSALNLESTASNAVTVVFTQVPFVANVQVTPSTISVNQVATLSANVTSANATVTAAEYFEGTDPGQGNGIPMNVVAGTASATLPSTLSVGQHTFTIRAEDSLGNWTTAPLPTVTLTVTLPILNGRVVNGANNGLSGVQVDVVSQNDHTNVVATTSTDSSGNYAVTVNTPGTYDVIFTPSDTHYEQVVKTGVNLTTSNTLDVVMALRPTTFQGTLKDENGAAITGATVSLHNTGGQTASGTTDQYGVFSVTVNPSTYALTISGTKAASPNAFIPTTFTLSGGSFNLTSNISNVPLVVRSAAVGFTTKSSLTGLTVGSVALNIGTSTSTTLYTGSDVYSGSATYNVTTDSDGNGAVVILEGSTYGVTAVSPVNSGVLTTSFPQVGPITSDPPTRELDLNADIKDYTGRVTDGTEISGLTGVTVRLSGANGTFQATTDSSGYFDIQAAAGTYTLSISGNASSGVSMPGMYSLTGCAVDLTGDNPSPVVFPIRTAKVTVTAKTPFDTTLDGVGVSLTSITGNVTVGNYLFTGSASNSGTTVNGSVDLYVLDDLAYNTKAVPAGGGYVTTNSSSPSPIVEGDTVWDIVLNRELHEFKGVVTDKNGQLVQGATVRLDGNEPDQHYSMTTGNDGSFDLFAAPNSAYSFRVSGTQAASTNAFLPDNYVLTKTVDVTSDVTSNIVVNAIDLQLLARDDRMNLIDGVGIAFSSNGSQNGFAASTSNVSRTTANGGQADLHMLSGTTYTITATPPANMGYINTTFNGTSPITQDSQVILEFQNHIPLAPTCVYVASPTNQAPALTWCAVANADHYFIYRDGVQISPSTGTTFTDATVTSDGTYSYRVEAVSADGYRSPLSDPASAIYDTTAPSLQYSLSAEPNANGWNTGPVTIAYMCNDALSGVASCPAPQTESTDGIYDLSATATDNAGNSATITPEIKIDQTAPTITYTLSPMQNTSDWNNSDVTVTFHCADAASGVASCSDPVTVSTEGGNQQITGTAADNAGNVASVTAVVNLDKTGPTFSYDLSPAPNANGWNNTPVTITYTCSDALSGVASCPSPQTISDDGVHLITAMATDNADNATTVNLTIKVDQTQPTISYTITPTPNANGWNNGDVTVSFDCQDALSGIASCTPPQPVPAEGANQPITGTAVDYAGNTAQITAVVNVDKTAPTVTGISWSANPLVQGQSTTLSATATDNLSQVGSMYYTVDGGAPQQMTYDPASDTWQATFGSGLAVNTYNIDVFAVDNAGNTSQGKMDVLAVYSTTSGSLSGHAWIMPTAADTLPIALDTSNHPAALVLGFSSQHGATTSVDAHYIVKNNQDEFDFSSTAVDWVVIPDSTHASLLVHGILTIYQGGVETTINDETMRLDVVLGTNGAADQINMRMWNPLLDPNSVPPTYQVNDSDLPNHSQLVIR